MAEVDVVGERQGVLLSDGEALGKEVPARRVKNPRLLAHGRRVRALGQPAVALFLAPRPHHLRKVRAVALVGHRVLVRDSFDIRAQPPRLLVELEDTPSRIVSVELRSLGDGNLGGVFILLNFPTVGTTPLRID